MPYTFLVGGARSGKSSLAVRLASAFEGPVVVVATAEARDDDMAERIRAHRSARPPEWEVVEAPMGLLGAVEGIREDASVILDCLTLWVSNALEEGPSEGDIDGEARKVASTLATRAAPSVVVSNEVGLGIVPANELARRYRDVLGRVNASFAAEASRCFFVVAGRGLPLDEVMQT
jgi:adenosyl cobinamide kinase/adenosyl cobinamide phosphate guanylyltransferase